MKIRTVLFALVVALALTQIDCVIMGGESSTGSGNCSSDEDCADGQRCKDSKCTESSSSCEGDSDCAGGERCNENKCMKQASHSSGFLCSVQNPCPTGQFCFNGICALGCTSNANCAEDQYCDTGESMLCINREVSSCPETPCEENQTCTQGICSVEQEQEVQCTPRPDGEDGCDAYKLCLDMSESEEQTEYSCVSFPPCPEDNQCPVGLIGSVCNEGYISGKARICLTGLCAEGGHCPGGFSCIKATSSPLGMCSDGSFGMPCLSSTDCDSDNGLSCQGAMAGGIGFCMLGFGESCTDAGGTCVDPMSGDCPGGTDVDGSYSCDSMMEMCCL